MNFNYDLATWSEYFIGAFICCLGALLIVGKILVKKEFKNIKKGRLLLLIPISIMSILNTYAFNNTILKVFGVLLLDMFVYKYILEETSIKIFIYSILSIMILSLAEILFVLIVSLFDYLFSLSIAMIVTNSIFSNLRQDPG